MNLESAAPDYSQTDTVFQQNSLRRLKAQLSGRGVIPFVGAGMSIAFGFPTWSGFLRKLSGRLGLDCDSMLELGQFEEVATLVRNADVLLFREEIKNTFGADLAGDGSPRHAEQLPKLFPNTPVFTTNYDRVLTGDL